VWLADGKAMPTMTGLDLEWVAPGAGLATRIRAAGWKRKYGELD